MSEARADAGSPEAAAVHELERADATAAAAPIDLDAFGVVAVLWNPEAEHLAHLERTRAVCRHMVAVDNSPQADAALHARLREADIEVVHNANRGGISGAYNRGAQVLFGRGCQVMFLLDQDSQLGADFFDGMMRACARTGGDAFIVGPKVFEANLGRYLPVFSPELRMPKPERIDDRQQGLIPTLFVISSGSAVSAAAFRKLGEFREDYFIEYVDIEYGMRATREGVPVFVNAGVEIRQKVGEYVKRGIFSTSNHVAWRRYYASRNAVHALRSNASRWSIHWLIELLTLHQVACVLVCEQHKLRKVVAIAVGYFDGLFGKLGTFEQRHPKVAAFCRH
ncbi:glycosyltransferase [Pseudomonas sp. CGJS7]|uniref:glycosyltransferase n=1 Tax=Pseudomonas sp. CGJS7 TaxID=3109348 RepID=UPI00300914C8